MDIEALYLRDFEDDDSDQSSTNGKEWVGRLKILSQKNYSEAVHEIFQGRNVIGRQVEKCSIAVPDTKTLSKEHACIEVQGDTHLIYDLGSRNKTKRDKMDLIPEVRYELKDGDRIIIADMICLYHIGAHTNWLKSARVKMNIEPTQALPLSDCEDDDSDQSVMTDADQSVTTGKESVVGRLKVLSQKNYSEAVHEIFHGKNVIGRQVEKCSIAVPDSKTLSKEHACIEVQGDTHLIYDLGSTNKTKWGKMYLTPEVRYELKDGDKIIFADVICVYHIGSDINWLKSARVKMDIEPTQALPLSDFEDDDSDQSAMNGKVSEEMLLADRLRNVALEFQTLRLFPRSMLALKFKETPV